MPLRNATPLQRHIVIVRHRDRFFFKIDKKLIIFYQLKKPISHFLRYNNFISDLSEDLINKYNNLQDNNN